MPNRRTYKIWLLTLVPDGRYGRCVIAALILGLGLGLFWLAVELAFRNMPATSYFDAWPTALFFVCMIAYIVPVFHFITQRTQQALTALLPYIENVEHPALMTSIDRQPLSWTLRVGSVGVLLWLVQSYVLAGSFTEMLDTLTRSFLSFLFVIGPLLVWVTMTTAMSALFRNALLFRRINEHLDVRIFEPDSYMPIGSMAVTSTLVVVGAFGLLSIMWLGGPVNWWTTLPAMFFFSPLLFALLLLPVLPIRKVLVQQRTEALEKAQAAIRQANSEDTGVAVGALANALSLRREVSRLPTWPFDVPAITRFVVYAVIVPLTWTGAALIEILVNAIVD
ncbi:MAG: hypothetical protein AAGC71_12900 [Pseudomonadota bacterium]